MPPAGLGHEINVIRSRQPQALVPLKILKYIDLAVYVQPWGVSIGTEKLRNLKSWKPHRQIRASKSRKIRSVAVFYEAGPIVTDRTEPDWRIAFLYDRSPDCTDRSRRLRSECGSTRKRPEAPALRRTLRTQAGAYESACPHDLHVHVGRPRAGPGEPEGWPSLPETLSTRTVTRY